MTTIETFRFFFPSIAIKQWWRKGTGCIRVRQENGPDLFFTYVDKDNWKLETAAIFELSKDGV